MKSKQYILRAIVDVVGLILCVISYVKHTPFPADPPKYPQDFLGKIIVLLGFVFVILFIRNCIFIRREKALSEDRKDADNG